MGSLAGAGVLGEWLWQVQETRLLTSPTWTAKGAVPFVDLELRRSAVEGSLGWGSEGWAEGDQVPQV